MTIIGIGSLSLSCLDIALNSSFLFYTDKFDNKWVLSLFFIQWFNNWWAEIYKVSWRQEETFIFDNAPSVCFTLSVSFPCSLRNTCGESPGDSQETPQPHIRLHSVHPLSVSDLQQTGWWSQSTEKPTAHSFFLTLPFLCTYFFIDWPYTGLCHSPYNRKVKILQFLPST